MSIRKRKWESDGKQKQAWVVDYIDQHGKRRHETFPTQKDAKANETRILSEISSGTHVSNRESITVAQASELWRNSWTARNLEPATTNSYEAILNYLIIPLVGHRLLNKFTTQDVIQFQTDVANSFYPPDYIHKVMRGKPRSRDAVRRATVVLGAIFATAQLNMKSTHNPVYDIPRKKRGYQKTDREKLASRPEVGIDIPTPDEIALILRHVCGWFQLLIVVAIFCGLRSSELRGLRWIDIDFKRGLLNVRQRADDRNKLGSPKSMGSFRTLTIPPGVLQSLLKWKAECPAGPDGLVFPSKRGRVAWYSNIIEGSLIPTMKLAGLMVDGVDDDGNTVLLPKYSGLHPFRHWYASWCINRVEEGGLGLQPKQVQERMGHSNIHITMDTYGHLFPIQNEMEALAKAEAILRGNKDAT